MSFEDTVKSLKAKGYIWDSISESSAVKPLDFLGSFKSLNEAATKKQKLKGGKGDKLTPDQVNYYEFKKGWKHELEHTDDIDKAKEIALDHLAEDPMYYTRLDMIEIKANKKKRTDLPIDISKKKALVKDDSNQMASVNKKKEKPNVSDSSKKEKARSKSGGITKMKGGSGEMKSLKEIYTSILQEAERSPVPKEIIDQISKEEKKPAMKSEADSEEKKGLFIVNLTGKEQRIKLTKSQYERAIENKKATSIEPADDIAKDIAKKSIVTVKPADASVKIDPQSAKEKGELDTIDKSIIGSKVEKGPKVKGQFNITKDGSTKKMSLSYDEYEEAIRKKVADSVEPVNDIAKKIVKSYEEGIKNINKNPSDTTNNDEKPATPSFWVEVYFDGKSNGRTVMLKKVFKSLTGIDPKEVTKETIKKETRYPIKPKDDSMAKYGPTPKGEIVVVGQPEKMVSTKTKPTQANMAAPLPIKKLSDPELNKLYQPWVKKRTSDIIQIRQSPIKGNYPYYVVNLDTKDIYGAESKESAKKALEKQKKANPKANIVYMREPEARAKGLLNSKRSTFSFKDTGKPSSEVSPKEVSKEEIDKASLKDYLVIDTKNKKVVGVYDNGVKAKEEALKNPDYVAVTKDAAGYRFKDLLEEQKDDSSKSNKDKVQSLVGETISIAVPGIEGPGTKEQVSNTVKKATYQEDVKKALLLMTDGARLYIYKDPAGKPVSSYYPKDFDGTVIQNDPKYRVLSTAAPLDDVINSIYDVGKEAVLEAYIREKVKKLLAEFEVGPYIGSTGPDVIKKKLSDYMKKYNPEWKSDPSPLQRDIGAEYEGIISKLVYELDEKEPGLGTKIYNQYTDKPLSGGQAYQATPPPVKLAYDPTKLVSRGGRIAE
jgi:hypothetical protein